jgi:hypothetical protein
MAESYVLRRLLHLPALVHLAAGRVDKARSSLETLAAERGRLMPVVHTNLLEVYALEEQGAEVEARADAVLSMARRSGARKELAQAHRALGIHLTSLRRWPEAEQQLTQALGIYRELDTRWEVGRTLYHLGLLHHRRHSRATAIRQRPCWTKRTRSFQVWATGAIKGASSRSSHCCLKDMSAAPLVISVLGPTCRRRGANLLPALSALDGRHRWVLRIALAEPPRQRDLAPAWKSLSLRSRA